jgi:DUF4097 and DUF4098 domain-containing protein YvlB
MKTIASLIALGIITAFSSTARAEKDTITKTFPIKAGGNLVMKVDRGSIQITTSDSDKVEVTVLRELKNTSPSKAKEVFAQHKIEMTSSDNEVKIDAENPQQSRSWGSSPFNHLHVEYTVAIPSKFNLDLKTAGGNIVVADLEGKVDLHTSGGDLKLAAIKGPVKAHTSGGNITLSKTQGDANLHTSGGDLRLGDIEGDLVAETSGGNITLDKIKGSVKAGTSGGDVRVKEAYGPINARTSGGNVSAQLNEQPKAACSLKTSGGNVDVKLADQLALDLNAHTSGGSIHSDFPGNLNKQKTTLTAQLNGGGPALVLETSGGSVNIRRK